MALFRKWGFGAELTFDGTRAVASMNRAQRATRRLRSSFDNLGQAASRIRGGILSIGAALTPVVAGIGLLGARASSLAGDLEAQTLTMRVLIGDAEKAQKLLGMIRENAAATPFQEGDLIEGSKRLLRLTGSNIDRNFELLQLVETMAALNPTKNVTDAVEAILDVTSGGGSERLKEFGLVVDAKDLASSGKTGGAAFAAAAIAEVQRQLLRQTGGADIVGELAKTFKGKTSTLKDAVENLLKPIGAEINKSLTPVIERATEVLKKLTAAFEALSPETKAQIGQSVIALGALTAAGGVIATVALGLGGFLAILGGILSGLVALGGALSAIGAAISSIGLVGAIVALGALAILLAPPAILAGGAALAAAFAFAVAGVDGLKGALFGLQAAVTEVFGPLIDELLPGLTEDFDALMQAITDIGGELGFLGASGQQVSDIFRGFGKVIFEKMVTPIRITVFLLRVALNIFTGLATIVQSLTRDVRQLGVAIFGVADGSLSVQQGIRLATLEAERSVLRLVGLVGDAILTTFEALLTSIGTALSNVPGLGDVGALVSGGALALNDQRNLLGSDIAARIESLDVLGRELESQRAEALTVNVPEQPIENNVQVESKLCVDDNEVARATASAAVRNGERGTGPTLPAEQRVRVLRSGLQVTALRPSEAF